MCVLDESDWERRQLASRQRQQINTKPPRPLNSTGAHSHSLQICTSKHSRHRHRHRLRSEPLQDCTVLLSSLAPVLAAPRPTTGPAPSTWQWPAASEDRPRYWQGGKVPAAVSARPYHAIYASLPSCILFVDFPRVSATTCSLLDSSVSLAPRRHLTLVPQAMWPSSRPRSIRTARPPPARAP